jgi:hypothetical protein
MMRQVHIKEGEEDLFCILTARGLWMHHGWLKHAFYHFFSSFDASVSSILLSLSVWFTLLLRGKSLDDGVVDWLYDSS